eukprot:6646235-Lingulodinium_polyedra.AAC.1
MGHRWMLRIGEAARPGPGARTAVRLVSANITSWGAAAKCITKADADVLCLQEARIRAPDAEAAVALARSRGYDLLIGRGTADGALLAAAARRGATW